MNKSANLTVARSLQLLEALQQTVASFAQREEQLERELLTRRATINRRVRDGLEKLEARLAAQVTEIEQATARTHEQIVTRSAARRTRVLRAQTAGLRALPKRAQLAKEKWMGDLQLKKFRAGRKRASDQETAQNATAKFQAQWEGNRAALEQLATRIRKGFRGYRAFLRLLERPPAPAADPASAPSLNELSSAFQAQFGATEKAFTHFHRFLLPRTFSELPLSLLLLPILMAGGILVLVRGPSEQSFRLAGAVVGALLLGAFLLHRVGFAQSRSTAARLAETLAEARRLLDACRAAAESGAELASRKRESRYQEACAALAAQWARAGDIEAEFEKAARQKLELQGPRILEKLEAVRRPQLQELKTRSGAQLTALREAAELERVNLSAAGQSDTAALEAREATGWAELEQDWRNAIDPLYEAVGAMNAALSAHFPAWEAAAIEAWRPPAHFPPATRFGHLALDLQKRAAALGAGPSRLALPGSPQLSLPLALHFPAQGSILVESRETAGPEIIDAFNNLILRLLSTTPAGKLSFTIIDPVGLGQNFAGLMHLADYEESLINRRIWTQRDQTEERLSELSAHVEKVIQMYLRNEYATITEYNAQAGSVAEKYHFLIVADFPASFSESAAKRLQSIAQSGPRCGIYTLIHWDQRQALPDGFAIEDLRKHSIGLRRDAHGQLALSAAPAESGATLILDPPPAPELAVRLVHQIGRSSIDSNRVEVPFAQIAPRAGELWTGDTTSELRIPIGRTGATKMQYLAIGKGTRQHALFAGKTGSGKSTLFHVIITNLALAFSPAQVEFYLIDFKKGVEFKCYASKRLPHARVVAIESDREFALSVLQRVDEELKRRGDLFRKLGVQDIAGYKKAGGAEAIPRSLLIIDEFQEFFVEDDAIAQTASLLFDRIVRQGRAFGIHVLLGSQTLGGAYTLARATLGQMVIRVALQCNEADAYLIMDDSNSAPRLLSRPGEGIYNDAAGAVEGNSPFQVVWLPDDERDAWLDQVTTLAAQDAHPRATPIVFEGNAPADLRENDLLHTLLTLPPRIAPAPAAARCWLGAPNSIKGPTEAVFQGQSGNHLLIVGQREEAALSILSSSLVALCAQYPPGSARFLLLHGATAGSAEAHFIERLLAALPHPVTVASGADVGLMMSDLAAELRARNSGEKTTADGPVFVLIHGLHKFKKLRHEEDFSFSLSDSEAVGNPGAQLNELITEGSSQRIHLLVSVDTFNNVNRFMNRKALSEFELRVVFQMSANDSASLIDSPKASGLGLHRALFYNEQQGSLETFRPYALPDLAWLEQLAPHTVPHV